MEIFDAYLEEIAKQEKAKEKKGGKGGGDKGKEETKKSTGIELQVRGREREREGGRGREREGGREGGLLIVLIHCIILHYNNNYRVMTYTCTYTLI